MDTGQQPISEEAKKNLTDLTLTSLQDYLKLIDSVRNSIRTLDKATAFMKNQNIPIPAEYLSMSRLGECALLQGLIWLDITAGCRVYLKAEGTYENSYAAKQLVVTINEGFKQLYGFQWYDKQGNLKSRERNQSFWIKDIGGIVKHELPSFEKDFNRITSLLDAYDGPDLSDLKDPRDLFVHYDKTPSKVYDEMSRQNMEKTFRKVIPLMHIISEMISFNKQLMQAYNSLFISRNEDARSRHLKKLEGLKQQVSDQPEVVEILSNMQNFVKNFGA
jgi:hypothetical protein